MSKIRATIITGFLGAGKTTLIRGLLEQDHGKRIALIINEFGDVGVDGTTLKGCSESSCQDIVELSNGCICCTVADDFIPTMETLLEQENPPQYIIIETSGLALPQPLVHAFQWPEIRHRVAIDGVITVVDTPAVLAGQFAHDEAAIDQQRQADDSLDHETPLEHLFKDQLRSADMVLMNKVDDLDEAAIAQAKQQVTPLVRPNTPVLLNGRAGISAAVLLGIGGTADHGDHHHNHDHDEHDHHDFESFSINGFTFPDADTARRQLQTLLAEHDILRLKGFVKINGKPMPLAVQAVGTRLETWFEKAPLEQSYLVVIGLHGQMQQQEITDAVKASGLAPA